MKKASSIVFLCCFIFLCSTPTEYEEDNLFAYYHKLSLQEPINTALTINNVCLWFSKQSAKISTFLVQKNKNYIFTYKFESDEPLAQIDLYYIKDTCTNIVLKTYINGSRYTSKFYDKEAKEVLLMFLNYNDDFEYHIK